ncbi:13572_t:CDS:10, partial [Ambispora gerdemannii]
TPGTNSSSRKPFDREAFLAKHKVRKIQPHEKEVSTSNSSVSSSSTKAVKNFSSTSTRNDQKNTQNQKSTIIANPISAAKDAKKPITVINSPPAINNDRVKSTNSKSGTSSSASSILSKSKTSTSQKRPDTSQSLKPNDTIGSKNLRKVDAAKVAKLLNFAGRKNPPPIRGPPISGKQKIKSLVDICISKIIQNIEMLNDIGNVPVDLLRPVLKSVSAEQLKRLQDNSEELAEVSNGLWRDLCLREFRNDDAADKRIRDELYNHEKLYWELDKKRKIKQEEDERRIQILAENTRKRYAREEEKKERKKIKVLPFTPLPKNRNSRQQKSIIRKLYDSAPKLDRPFRTSSVAASSRSGSTSQASVFVRGTGSSGSTVRSSAISNSLRTASTSVASVRPGGVERRQNGNERFLPYRRTEASSSRSSSQGVTVSRERQ